MQSVVPNPRPGSPIPTGDTSELRMQQLGIFQQGGAEEKGINFMLDRGLRKERSFFENTNVSLELVASRFEDVDCGLANGDQDRDRGEREDSRQRSLSVRNLKYSKSLCAPSCSFSSLRFSRSSSGMPELPKYNKVTGSFSSVAVNTELRSSQITQGREDEDESDDDGSLKSSLADESDSEVSDSSSTAGDFMLKAIPDQMEP